MRVLLVEKFPRQGRRPWPWLLLLAVLPRARAQELVEPCVDSATWHKTGDESRTCKWVGAARTAIRCNAKGYDDTGTKSFAWYSCPKTCGTPCADDAYYHKKDDANKTCAWVALAPQRCETRGDDKVLAKDACPVACDVDLAPRRETFASCEALGNARPSWLKDAQVDVELVGETLAERTLSRIIGGDCANHDDWYWEFAPTPLDDSSGGIDGAPAEQDGGNGDPSFSETNNQEVDVDEADVVKAFRDDILFIVSTTTTTDGCAYRLSAVRDLGEDSSFELLSSVPLEATRTSPDDILISGNTLLLIGSAELAYEDDDDQEGSSRSSWYMYEPATVLLLFDVEDPTNPTLLRRLIYEGTYVSARLIESAAYVVISKLAAWGPDPKTLVPYFLDEIYDVFETRGATEWAFTEESSSSTENGTLSSLPPMQPISGCEDVAYVWPSFDELEGFTVIVGLDLASPQSPSGVSSEVVATRTDRIVYASKRSLYVTQQQWVGHSHDEALQVVVDEWESPTFRTYALKFTLRDATAIFDTAVDVPGWPVNQFALSESSDGAYLRIATTARSSWDWTKSSSGVSVFDANDGSPVSAVTHLAPGESIFSARFVGDDLCYLITFVEVDPLFAIDLADPARPFVVSELKVPGFSQYLHPLFFANDDTVPGALVGLGRDVDNATALIEGLQLSLFDVANTSNLALVDQRAYGDRGSDSDALTDHKAFFITQYNDDDYIFAFPATLASDALAADFYGDDFSPWASGLDYFQGALVFRVTPLEAGGALTLNFLGNSTHLQQDFFQPYYVCYFQDDCADSASFAYNDTSLPPGYWSTSFDTRASGYHTRRLLRRGDFLFTVSDNAITKSHLLTDIASHLARLDMNDPELLVDLSWTGPAVLL